MSRWVIHKSGQGERWEVYRETENQWNCFSTPHVNLPKSEYIPCDPPEKWEDVTGDIVEGQLEHKSWVDNKQSYVAVRPTPMYRLRKIDGLHYGHAFIIERKKP